MHFAFHDIYFCSWCVFRYKKNKDSGMVVVSSVLPSGFGLDHDAMKTVCLIQLIHYIHVDVKL